ncbi:MAG: metallophosphoesterase family protein [Candidatus Acidiferrales bacterium]
MRVAIVSDNHGNRTAFEAVLADLRQTSPDLILHGGDCALPFLAQEPTFALEFPRHLDPHARRDPHPPATQHHPSQGTYAGTDRAVYSFYLSVCGRLRGASVSYRAGRPQLRALNRDDPLRRPNQR